jgi:hypothetical protein
MKAQANGSSRVLDQHRPGMRIGRSSVVSYSR